MMLIQYSGFFNALSTTEPLPAEGMMEGRFGPLRFRKCEDGIAIIESRWGSSGFVMGGGMYEIGLPQTLNGIPVTEYHHTIEDYHHDGIVIDGGSLKRVYVNILNWTSGEAHNLGLSICGSPVRLLDLCSIRSSKKFSVKEIPARVLRIMAPEVCLCGHGDANLEEAYLPDAVFPDVMDDWYGLTVYDDYFAGCKKLKAVKGFLRGERCWSFRNCSALEEVHLADGMKSVPSYAFEGCVSLRDLFIPDTVMELGEYAFANCSSLQSIHLPANIKVIPKGLFQKCHSLRKCFLSDQIEVIDDFAFQECTSLRKPWIPKNIQKIGTKAFDHPEWCLLPEH